MDREEPQTRFGGPQLLPHPMGAENQQLSQYQGKIMSSRLRWYFVAGRHCSWIERIFHGFAGHSKLILDMFNMIVAHYLGFDPFSRIAP